MAQTGSSEHPWRPAMGREVVPRLRAIFAPHSDCSCRGERLIPFRKALRADACEL
jgi:hypothetical protein